MGQSVEKVLKRDGQKFAMERLLKASLFTELLHHEVDLDELFKMYVFLCVHVCTHRVLGDLHSHLDTFDTSRFWEICHYAHEAHLALG